MTNQTKEKKTSISSSGHAEQPTSTWYGPPEDISAKINQITYHFNILHLAPAKLFFAVASIMVATLNRGLTVIDSFGLPGAAATSMDPEEELSVEIAVSPSSSTFAKTSTMVDSIHCEASGNVKKCFAEVCNTASHVLIPLNKPRRVGESISQQDSDKLVQIIKDSSKKGHKAFEKLEKRASKVGLNMESPALRHLGMMEFFLPQIDIPNCAGGAAFAFVLMGLQPVTSSHNVTLQFHSARNILPESKPHTTMRIKTASREYICDTFRPDEETRKPGPVKICDSKQIQSLKGNCAYYHQELWNPPDPMHTVDIKTQNNYKLNGPQQAFFNKEIKRQKASIQKKYDKMKKDADKELNDYAYNRI